MQEDINLKPIEIKRYIVGNEEINSISARDLWINLESKQQFADWVSNKLKANMAEQDVDYIPVLETYSTKNDTQTPENTLISEVYEIKNSYFTNSLNQKKRGDDRRSIDYIITLDLAKEFSMLEKIRTEKL